MFAQPQTGFEAVADQHLGQLRIAAISVNRPFVEILAFRVAAEVDGAEVEIGDVGCQPQEIVDGGYLKRNDRR